MNLKVQYRPLQPYELEDIQFIQSNEFYNYNHMNSINRKQQVRMRYFVGLNRSRQQECCGNMLEMVLVFGTSYTI